MKPGYFTDDYIIFSGDGVCMRYIFNNLPGTCVPEWGLDPCDLYMGDVKGFGMIYLTKWNLCDLSYMFILMYWYVVRVPVRVQ